MEKLKSKSEKINSNFGFTLIELLAVVAILTSVIGAATAIIDPAQQLNKARDAASLKGLSDLRTAMDSYYQDFNCYPEDPSDFTTALASGAEWNDPSTSTIYMKEVPFDGYGDPYIYMTETPPDTCPQWYVLFSRLSAAPTNASENICPLDNETCQPVGFDSSWACVTGGITNCVLLSGAAVDEGSIVYPSITPIPTGSPTPTPSLEEFTVALPSNVRPQFFTGIINNPNPSPGENVTFTISSENESNFINPADLSTVTAQVTSDTQVNNYAMVLAGGNLRNGIWSATWPQNDTVDTIFIVSIIALDANGSQSSFDVVIR